ncbi:MAG TPA: DUF1579 family protein [Anaeromyxobacteraceae bacterium]|nr:DUF1579 family protein [Anaeromyxobacteraceae bacterium]
MATAVALWLLFAPAALAQAPKAPKPGPEHERLGYFVGKWKSEGTVAENPFMPAGKVTSSDSCEWFEGKFAVVCRSQGKGPMGPSKGLGIMSYSAEEKAYLYYGVENNPMAMTTVPKGTVEGDTWIYTDESKMGDKVVKSRYTIKVLDKKSYTFKYEMEGPDGQWKTVVEGKSTRA